MNTITIRQIVNSVYSSNSYILSSSEGKDKGVWIIDIGDVNELLKHIPSCAVIKGVLFTHTHYDHIYGVNELITHFPNIRLFTNELGKKALCSPKLNYSRYHKESTEIVCNKPENIEIINDGDQLMLFDNVPLKVIATPGHDASCLTFITDYYVFSGDSYIPRIKTRATFLLSDKSKVELSEQLIINLSTGKILCPGHGPIYLEFNKIKT